MTDTQLGADGNRTLRVVVAYHSGYGHTAKQAEAVARGAREAGDARVTLVDVSADNDAAISAIDAADAVVFGSPTYMGAASAAFKQFAEATSEPWADGLRWQGKVAGGFTNSQNINGNKENTLIELFVLAAQHGMHWVTPGLYGGWNTTTGSTDDLNRLGAFTGAMAQSYGDAGPDQAPPQSDLDTAAALGRRVTEVARDLAAGRRTLQPVTAAV
ncbi:flavodoxin family protein [Kineococcus sp. NUM-3379]